MSSLLISTGIKGQSLLLLNHWGDGSQLGIFDLWLADEHPRHQWSNDSVEHQPVGGTWWCIVVPCENRKLPCFLVKHFMRASASHDCVLFSHEPQHGTTCYILTASLISVKQYGTSRISSGVSRTHTHTDRCFVSFAMLSLLDTTWTTNNH